MKWSIVIVMASYYALSLWSHGGFEDIGESIQYWLTYLRGVI